MAVSLGFGHHRSHDDTQEHRAYEANHEGCSDHTAAMLFVFASFSRRQLYITSLTVYMWFRSENTGDGLSEGLGLLSRSRARRGLVVLVRVQLNVVLGDGRILDMASIMVSQH